MSSIPDSPIMKSQPAPVQARLRAILANPAYRRLLQAVLILGVFMIFMALVQFSTPDMPDNDGYYHIKLAQLMRTETLKPDFPWLPLSILNPREFSDHHFLFHVGLIPFTFGDLRLGAKWASVVFSSLAFLSLWWLFSRQRVPYAWLWSLGALALSQAFIYRMSITRAQSLSLAFLVIALGLLLSRRHAWLLPLAFLYVWLYDAFPLILILAGAYVLGVALVERRLEWRPLVYAGIGVGFGLLVNPYFPHNVVFLFNHLLPKLSDATSVSVGSEWYPYNTTQLLNNSPLALLAFLAGVLGLGLNERRMDVRTATSFFLAVIFGLMLFQSRRFIEYFPAFTLIFAAFAWTPVIEARQVRRSADQDARETQSAWQRFALHWLPVLILGVFIIPGIWVTYRDSRQSIRDSKPYDLYSGASAWLQANTQPGERVFQTDWDDFPRLFFYNTHNTYLIGLDPTYMSLYNPALYDEWVDITRGRVEQPSRAIVERFGARFVISDTQHDDFIRQAQADQAFEEVYRDDQSVVYRITY